MIELLSKKKWLVKERSEAVGKPLLNILFICVILAVLIILDVQGQQTCKLNLQRDLDPSKEPLILTKSKGKWGFVWPKVDQGNGVLSVKHGSSLLLACPGKGNKQETSGKQTAIATCFRGSLKVNKKKVNKKTSSCSEQYAESSIQITDKKCGTKDNRGIIIQMGFKLNDGTWNSLISTCHDVNRSVTYYSSHQINGASLDGRIRSDIRSPFSRGPKPLYSKVNPEAVYAKKGQINTLGKILGKERVKRYIKSKGSSYLARGHLAPDADFIYNSGQLSTYYYVNVMPQWQAFNGGNWLTVENTVRSLASKVKKTLNLWTGTYGVLKLEKHKIYLEPEKKLIPVPELYWKLVENPDDKKCTVVIGANNLFLTKVPASVCPKAHPRGWPLLENLHKGYVYYCGYEDFKTVIDYTPKIDCNGGLFEFPKAN